MSPTVKGPKWRLVTTSTLTPASRQSGAMVYDPAAHEFVMFGGYSSSGSALGDTWVFANGQWTDLTANLSTAPSARWYFDMVYDPAAGYVLLFGGRDAYTDFNDTWAFNGTTWVNLNLAHAPPPITAGRVAYDAVAHAVYLYGGYSIMFGAPNAYNFTWTFSHGTWHNLTARVTGAPPDPHVVTYSTFDTATGGILLFGGDRASNGTCSVPGYTWMFANGTYTNLSAGLAVAPPLGQGSRMMVYDPLVSGVLLYGGWDGPGCASYSNETWVFHAGAWSLLHMKTNPGPLWDGAMAANPARNTVLLFGGNVLLGPSSQSQQTWRFGP